MTDFTVPDKKFTKVCSVFLFGEYCGPKMNKTNENTSLRPWNHLFKSAVLKDETKERRDKDIREQRMKRIRGMKRGVTRRGGKETGEKRINKGSR